VQHYSNTNFLLSAIVIAKYILHGKRMTSGRAQVQTIVSNIWNAIYLHGLHEYLGIDDVGYSLISDIT